MWTRQFCRLSISKSLEVRIFLRILFEDFLKFSLHSPVGLQQGLGNSSANAQAQAQAQAHMMQFNPLLYSYQLSMAHQALGNFSGVFFPWFFFILNFLFCLFSTASAGKSLNVNEIQRLAEMQRQYLMDIIPQQQQQQQQQSNSNSNRQNNWKT